MIEENDGYAHEGTPKPLEEGRWILKQVSEGWVDLVFDPPQLISYTVWKENGALIAYISFAFGMEYSINLDNQRKSSWHYSGINEKSTNEEIINSILKYDLFHAFTHYQGDPNYSHLHWAIYGNLKNQVKVVEHFTEFPQKS